MSCVSIESRWEKSLIPRVNNDGCFTADTPVLTDNGRQPIQTIRVGQRVPTGVESTGPQTEINPAEYCVIKLTCLHPESGYPMEITFLRPASRYQGIKPGDKLPLFVEELQLDQPAEVVAIEPCPPIEPGAGQLVTGTFTHENLDVRLLKLTGLADPLEVTGVHPIYSQDRGEFVAVKELQIGERLLTRHGIAQVESIGRKSGLQRVYNLEIGDVHQYYVAEIDLLVHNAGEECPAVRIIAAAESEGAEAAKLQPYGGPGGGHHVPAKSAFTGAAGYDPKAALAISNEELARLGVKHELVTGAQMTGYRAFAKSGKTLTWAIAENIETQALIRGGMQPSAARAAVQQAIQALRNSGVIGPTRIPWGRV